MVPMSGNAIWAQQKIISSVKDVEKIIGKDLELLSGDSFYGDNASAPEYEKLKKLATEIKQLLSATPTANIKQLTLTKTLLEGLRDHINSNSEALDPMMSRKRSDSKKGNAQAVKLDSDLRSTTNEFLTKIEECLSGIDNLSNLSKQSDSELLQKFIASVERNGIRDPAITRDDMFKLQQMKNIFQGDKIESFVNINVEQHENYKKKGQQSTSFREDIANLKQCVKELSQKTLPVNAKLYLEEFSKRLNNYNPQDLNTVVAPTPTAASTLRPLPETKKPVTQDRLTLLRKRLQELDKYQPPKKEAISKEVPTSPSSTLEDTLQLSPEQSVAMSSDNNYSMSRTITSFHSASSPRPTDIRADSSSELLRQQFEKERKVTQDILEREKKEQLENIEKRVQEQKAKRENSNKKPEPQLPESTPVPMSRDDKYEMPTKLTSVRPPVQPLPTNKRVASSEPRKVPELQQEDENTDKPDINEGKRKDIPEEMLALIDPKISQEKIPETRAQSLELQMAAAVNIQKVFRGFLGRKEAKEEYVTQLINQLEGLTQDLAKAKSREDIDNIEKARSDWGTKEDNFYDKYLKNGDSDSKENENILSRITEQNNKYGKALAEAELRAQRVEEASRELSAPIASMGPLLRVNTKDPQEQPVIPPSSSKVLTHVDPLTTDMPSRPSTSVPPSKPESLIAATLVERLARLGSELAEQEAKSIERKKDRQSVLSTAQEPSKGLIFNKENLCAELGEEHFSKGEPEVIFTHSTEDAPSTQKLSFSDGDKTVTLPNNNVIKNTQYALNTIARSNMVNHRVGASTASIGIENVKETDLLEILEKFNADITQGDGKGVKGHLQLSYENPNKQSPNELDIQEVIQKHNDLHSMLQKTPDAPQSKEFNDKLEKLQESITTLKNKLEVQHAAPQEALPNHGSSHSRRFF